MIGQLFIGVEQKVEYRITIVISTVLLCTLRKYVLPKWSKVIMFGIHDEDAAEMVEAFYKTTNTAPFYYTAVGNPELIQSLL